MICSTQTSARSFLNQQFAYVITTDSTVICLREGVTIYDSICFLHRIFYIRLLIVVRWSFCRALLTSTNQTSSKELLLDYCDSYTVMYHVNR